MPPADREREHLTETAAWSPPRIRIRGLCAGYAERQVLGPLSFDLRQGETSAFVGPGGAGKSTLLRILHRTPEPDLWLRGRVAYPAVPSRLLRQKSPAIDGSLGERLRDAADGRGAAEAIAAVWSSNPEAAACLQGLADAPLSSIGREAARLAWLTLALAGEPPLVLLDEPDAELQEPWFSWVRGLLVAWRSRTTLVLATHHLGIAREASDRVFLLIGGKLVESAPTAEIFDRPKLPRTRDFLRMGS